MPEEVIHYVTSYGYYAIFILVFLQEIGMPNPVPNELLLAFSGYLSFKGMLSFPMIIVTVILADFTGTNILYFVFYKTGSFILKRKPAWIPLSPGLLERLTSRISGGGQLSIYIFRLTPFIRGYTSVISGLLRIKPVVFLPIALTSAATWAAFYVSAGYYIGPSWNIFIENKNSLNYILPVMLTLISVVLLVIYLTRKKGDPDQTKDLEITGKSENI